MKAILQAGADLKISKPDKATKASLLRDGKGANQRGDVLIVPCRPHNLMLLARRGVELPKAFQNLSIYDKSPSRGVLSFPTKKFEASKRWLRVREELRPYQQKGVLFIEQHRKILLADDMGLGKTVQVLSWMAMRLKVRPVLIICPSSAKINWQEECLKWVGEEAEVLESQTPYPITKKIVIINYDILPHWDEYIKTNLNPKAMVVDECQHIKNESTLACKSVRLLINRCRYRIMISGTPIINRPAEFYTVLNMLYPHLFQYWDFMQRYCEPSAERGKLVFKGATNLSELNTRLNKGIMIRRLKKDVLKELPPKNRMTVRLELKNRKEYDAIVNDETIDETGNKIEALKQACLNGKIDHCIEWVRDFLYSGKKLIVFCNHYATIDRLKEEFKSTCVVLDGRCSSDKKRQKAKVDFQTNPKINLFIGQMKAAGTAITLTAASDVCFFEPGWSPSEHDQAEDRAHRFGQTERVNIWYMIARGTIDETIMRLIAKKRKVISKIMDGKEVKDDIEITKQEILKQLRSEQNENERSRRKNSPGAGRKDRKRRSRSTVLLRE